MYEDDDDFDPYRAIDDMLKSEVDWFDNSDT